MFTASISHSTPVNKQRRERIIASPSINAKHLQGSKLQRTLSLQELYQLSALCTSELCCLIMYVGRDANWN